MSDAVQDTECPHWDLASLNYFNSNFHRPYSVLDHHVWSGDKDGKRCKVAFILPTIALVKQQYM